MTHVLMILDDYIQSYLQDHLRPLVHVGSRGVAFQYSTHTKVQARVYTNIEIHHACVQSPLQKKWTPPAPNYPWFSLGSNKYNHSKGSPLEELFSIREKGFVASKHTMFTNIISIGASQIIKLHSIANCQYTIVAKHYSTSIMCVYGSKLVRKLDD